MLIKYSIRTSSVWIKISSIKKTNKLKTSFIKLRTQPGALFSLGLDGKLVHVLLLVHRQHDLLPLVDDQALSVPLLHFVPGLVCNPDRNLCIAHR